MKKTVPVLQKKYKEEIAPHLMKTFGYKNVMQVPRLSKITLSIGLGNARDDKSKLDHALEDLTTIAGQKPVVTYAKKAISNFKIRKGDPVGIMVTLRDANMYEFLIRFINIALPRVRDFNGVSDKAFDGQGNYSLGITEQVIFPEIDYDKVDVIRGMNLTFTTTAKTDREAYELLKEFGFPFVRRNEK
ncbi:MAG: 50S ribosomal protein L5 [Candidatus Marinimicrobia bacterium]|jgi:large subunit ribosomal protein L5|nr:50S ribosomal protein L5 [Candidatus Neomarinimicrobiota bacterium]MDD4960682.1 50S ribosomal protein L5 [Candidatus Neomarinimicrobiota bacterium]MDD5709199.1 50S ribosomal protein L5 [Candidatus Neomarinimicrobiota bacterium]MDX9777932.1 50S ribosomal protein L5 [bacterium]